MVNSIKHDFTGINSLVKFIELFKSWGYRQVRNRGLFKGRNPSLKFLQNYVPIWGKTCHSENSPQRNTKLQMNYIIIYYRLYQTLP